jgi:translocator protein
MDPTPNAQDRMRSILLLVATIGTIVFNSLAATGYVNNVTPEIISDKYPTVLTPAGYAFSIWSLIYLGLIAFSIYQILPRNLVRFRSVRSLYVITCVLNCSWIYFWHHDQIGFCLGLIAALLLTLIAILFQLRKSTEAGGALFTTAVFGIYAGWVTAATLVNFAIFLKSQGAEMSAAAWNVIGVLAILFAAVLGVLIRFKLRNFLYPLAVAWAATAIAVKQSGNTAIVVAASVCVIVCLVMSISFVMDKKGAEPA